ncbi:putative lipoprotein [Streptomyces davaonensis JCM 4913]|uniref:Putative lipoprotein n=1 Tax=Streptomyces davaonensis (strain DSM 101723 / JCM 4913 / KCC S-0913 / 768) TaxID=1214101 RepID=K4RFY0_STRDJ|nr:hypothetical protein [Streptomyces davaonensis]CCK32039.1 putative lipoprotein [Streptomyces davaonensis JCM 4913]
MAATACSSDDAPSAKNNPATPAAPKPVAALSDAQARAVITNYSKINNEANAQRDRTLLDTVEDGPLYAMSVSDYTETEGLPKADRKPYKPWSYDTSSAKLYIPRFTTGQDRWFAAALSGEKGKDPGRIAVFAEQPKNKRWELVSVVDLDSKTLPDIALDKNGYATAVAATGNNQLAADANLLRTAVIDNFATGGRNTGTKVFDPTKASQQQIKVHDETTRKFGKLGTTVFSEGTNRFTDAYALKTSDGGALVLFAHTHTQTDAVAHSGLQINPDKDDNAWLHGIPRTSVTYTFVCADAATVPAKAAPSRLIGYTCARTDASGPPVGSAPTDRA